MYDSPNSSPFHLRYWDDPILSQVCTPITSSMFGQRLAKYALSLASFMDSHKGVGIAAPQVGDAFRLFIMKTKRGVNEIVCNPTLSFEGVNLSDREGCLSTPTVFEAIHRRDTVLMRYFTPLGDEKEGVFHGIDARIIAHEEDHLNGIMFFDRRRVSRQVNKSVERKWGKVKNKYRHQTH